MQSNDKCPLKDTVFRLQGYSGDFEVKLRMYHISDLTEHPLHVYAFDVDRAGEEMNFMRVPLRCNNAIAVTAFQSVCHLTVPLVDNKVVALINVAQGVVAGDWMAAFGQMALLESFLIKHKGLLTVYALDEGFGHTADM